MLEIVLQHPAGLLFVAAVNLQAATVVKQRAGADQRQRAFGIGLRVKPLVDKTNVTVPGGALGF